MASQIIASEAGSEGLAEGVNGFEVQEDLFCVPIEKSAQI